MAEVASPQPGRGRQPARNEFAGSQAGQSGQGLGRRLLHPPSRGVPRWSQGPARAPRPSETAGGAGAEPQLCSLKLMSCPNPPGVGRVCGGGCHLSVPQFPYQPPAAVLPVTQGPTGMGVALGLGTACLAAPHKAAILLLPRGSPALGTPIWSGAVKRRGCKDCVQAPQSPWWEVPGGPSLAAVADELIPPPLHLGGL